MRKHVAEQHKDSRKEMDERLAAQLCETMDHLTIDGEPIESVPQEKTKFPICRECYVRAARENGLPKFHIDAYEDTQ